MVNLGTISWAVQVSEAADAAASAAEVQQEFGKTAEKAHQANEATNQASTSMGSYGASAGRAAGISSRLSGVLAILTSAVFFLRAGVAKLIALMGGKGLLLVLGKAAVVASFLAGKLVVLAGLLPSLSAVWAGLSGVVGKFVGWLAAGSAGALAFAAVLGGLLGLVAVGVLEWLGILDAVRRFGQYLGGTLPGVATDALLALISIFAGPLAVIGGFITGFVQGFLEGGLVQGIRDGVAEARQVLDIFAGAWDRLFSRLRSVGSNFLSWLGGVPGRVRSIFSGMGDSIGSALRSGFNAIIPSSLSVPEITIGGGSIAGQDLPSATIGGQSLDLPQLNTGGFIEAGGLAELHAGETVVPADVTRNIFGGGGGEGGSQGVTIEEIAIEFGDQSLDIRSMSPGEVRRLAEALAPELGREVESIISP